MMSEVKIVVKLDMEKSVPPEGYKFTGEFKIPEDGDYFLSKYSVPTRANGYTGDAPRHILEKIRPRAKKYTQSGDAPYEGGNYFLSRLQVEKALVLIEYALLEVSRNEQS